MGRAIGAGRRRLAAGSPRALRLRGALLVLAVAGIAALTGWMVTLVSARAGLVGGLLEALALASILALRGLALAARSVARDLARGALGAAREAVGRDLVSRPTAALDERLVASAAIESVAENLTDSVVAPLLFYVFLGLPAAAFYRAVNTADAMIGYREGDLEHFGKAAARLDDLLNLLPARLAALSLAGGAALAGADARGALSVMWRQHGRTASPNAGWTMAAMAGALGVTLEKPGHYRLGLGRAPRGDDIRRAVIVLGWAAFLALIATVAAVESLATFAVP